MLVVINLSTIITDALNYLFWQTKSVCYLC